MKKLLLLLMFVPLFVFCKTFQELKREKRSLKQKINRVERKKIALRSTSKQTQCNNPFRVLEPRCSKLQNELNQLNREEKLLTKELAEVEKKLKETIFLTK